METKLCSRCKKEYEATSEFFSRCKITKDGFQSWCKPCSKEVSRIRFKRLYQNDPEFRIRDNSKSREKQRVLRSNPEYRERQRQDGKKRRESPIYRELESKKYQERSKTEHFKSLRRAASHRRRAKEKGADGTHNAIDVELQYKAQKGLCWHCGIELVGKYEVDHLVPLDRGGTNWPNNIVCSCQKCNRSKGKKLVQEWNNKLI